MCICSKKQEEMETGQKIGKNFHGGKKGRVAKHVESMIESVGATISRPQADIIRPYIRGM